MFRHRYLRRVRTATQLRFGAGLFFNLELAIGDFYCRGMKRIFVLVAAIVLGPSLILRAQDAATEERLNKLEGKIEDLRSGQDALRRQTEVLSKEIEALRDHMGKPTGNYAAQEDLKRLADAVKEVDRKRIEDAEKVRNELLKLQKSLSTPTPPRRTPSASENSSPTKPEGSDKGYEYVVKKGDTLSIIVKAYRDNNVKVTTDQILKANPGLKPEKLTVGQKIWVPAPQ
jgi:LysM repeat protein